jgi:hypothetical protein
MAGQNNHFLITIFVGLAAVENGTAELPDWMRVSWAPHDRSSSAARSREFATKALLGWIIDALNTYVCLLERPPIVANAAIIDGIARVDADREGLAGRVRSVVEATGQAGSAEDVLVDVAIAWHNRLVHHVTDKRLSGPLVGAAHARSAEFYDLYQGLKIGDLIRRVERTQAAAPTLKEVTAIVRAVHKLVERADGFLLQDLDLVPYLREVLRQYLVEDQDTNPKGVMIRASKVWGKSPDRRRSAITQIAFNRGFTAYCDGAPNKLVASAIDALAEMSPADAAADLAPSQTKNL